MRVSLLAAPSLLLGLLAIAASEQAQETVVNAPSPADNAVLVAANGQEAQELYLQAKEILERPHASTAELNVVIEKLDRSLQMGHAAAAEELARLLFFGRDTLEPDYTRAAIYLEKCAEPECHFLLGLFYSNALGGKERSMPHALAYYGIGAERMNKAALTALGWAHNQGRAVAKNCFKARDYYFPVAKEMAQRIEREHIKSFPKQPKLTYDRKGPAGGQSSREVLGFYQDNADGGDAASLFFLGQVFYLGMGGIERNLPQARIYFEQASKLGHASATGYLGQMDFYGEGLSDGKPDYRRAYHNFRRAAKEKSATGLNGMGLLYWRGIEVMADREEAMRYFKQAAELDNPEASYHLGRVLQEIDPVANEDRIFSAYLMALRGGQLLAGFELAKMNMEKDITCGLAKYLLGNFLEKQPSMAMIDEANKLFYSGHMGAALSRYLYLAEQGSEAAQYNAAFVLEHLARRTNDDSLRRRALVWWDSAADQGNVDAMLMAGDYFYYGYGIKQPSPVTAAAYYHKALEKRSPQGAFNLAYLHEHGSGVPQDYNMARRYYEQASSLGAANEMPEAWLPAYMALKHLSVMQRVQRIRKHLHELPEWTVAAATIIVFGMTTLFLAVYSFGLGRPRPTVIMTQLNSRGAAAAIHTEQSTGSDSSSTSLTLEEPLLPPIPAEDDGSSRGIPSSSS